MSKRVWKLAGLLAIVVLVAGLTTGCGDTASKDIKIGVV
jgi:branched-chain amino acid transport system substrate-binding protein